jgi:hypothetical protein
MRKYKILGARARNLLKRQTGTPALINSDASLAKSSGKSKRYFARVFVASMTTFFRSSTNARICCRRDSASAARKMEDGWTVAIVKGASSDSTNFPCCRVTLNSLPNKD